MTFLSFYNMRLRVCSVPIPNKSLVSDQTEVESGFAHTSYMILGSCLTSVNFRFFSCAKCVSPQYLLLPSKDCLTCTYNMVVLK